MIDTLQIETANTCNNRCAFCPHHKVGSPEIMDMGLFRKIIDQAAEMKIRRIVPFLNGEPLCDPYIFERLSYVREKMPGAFIELFTNGVLLTEKNSEFLRAFSLDFVNISVNAESRATYRKVTGRDSYDVVVRNAKYFIDNGIAKKTRVSMVPYGMDADKIGKFKEQWKGHNCEVQVNELYNWHGDVGTRETRVEPCFRITSHMTVLASGKVSLCCMDTGENLLGDLNREKIWEVWKNSEYMRWMHLQYKRPMMEPCCWCNMK